MGKEITIFAKKRNSSDGRVFFTYLTTLKRNDGTEQTMSVKFRENCGKPKAEDCPMNIIIEKEDANIAKKQRTREDTGEIYTAYTLWINAWKKGSEYVDRSLDEFDV